MEIVTPRKRQSARENREKIRFAPNVATPKTFATFSPKSRMRRHCRAMKFESEGAFLASGEATLTSITEVLSFTPWMPQSRKA